MDIESHFAAAIAEHEEVLHATRNTLAQQFVAMLHAWFFCVRAGHTIFFFGNGGSAADAQHLAAELVVKYDKPRLPISAMALTADVTLLTAAANDFSFDQIFARQIQALGRPGDIAVALSTSGRSVNVINGLKAARDRGMVPVAFGGGDGGALTALANPLLIVPSNKTSLIQEMHIMLGHMLCSALEIELKLVVDHKNEGSSAASIGDFGCHARHARLPASER
jgi:D-sedoheptulose 7-phosphate isomerase